MFVIEAAVVDNEDNTFWSIKIFSVHGAIGGSGSTRVGLFFAIYQVCWLES